MFLWLRRSLRRQLALTFSMIIILMVTMVVSFSYFHTAKTIQQDAEGYSKQILGQANLNLARYYRDSELFFTTLAFSKEFRKWMLTPSSDAYSLIFLMKDMQTHYIEPYITYHPEILSIVLFNDNGNENIYRSGNPNAEAILKPNFSASKEAWLNDLQLNGEVAQFVDKPDRYADQYGRSAEIQVMTFAQKFQVQNQIVYLVMDLSLQPTNEILQEIMQGNKATAMISDGDGNLIAFSDSSKVTGPLPQSIRKPIMTNKSGHYFEQESRTLVIFETVPGSKWKIIVQIPYDEVARSIYVVRNFTLLVALVSLLGGLFLVMWVSDSITRRIQLLRQTIKSTELGDFDVRVPVSGIDEVAVLARSYNSLLDQIEESILQLTESKLVHQKAILSALQSQINSHFLYNALESINSMANIAGHTEIRQTALALSKLLRYTSNYSQFMVTLRDEVKSLNDYMYIIMILYGDQIACHIELPADLEGAICLKALFQPIVENCIKHGYETIGDKLSINIRVERTDDDFVCVSIADDGPGFDKGKLSQIRSRLQYKYPEKEFNEIERIGLLNLHYRLKMVYNDSRSGIYILDQSMKTGAVIQIVFPFR